MSGSTRSKYNFFPQSVIRRRDLSIKKTLTIISCFIDVFINPVTSVRITKGNIHSVVTKHLTFHRFGNFETKKRPATTQFPINHHVIILVTIISGNYAKIYGRRYVLTSVGV